MTPKHVQKKLAFCIIINCWNKTTTQNFGQKT